MIARPRLALTLLVFALAFTGCATQRSFIFEPKADPLSEITSPHEAVYPLPSEPDTQGHLRVSSSGMKYLDSGDKKSQMRLLHLRMNVANGSHRSWSIEPKEQIIEFPSSRRGKPDFVGGDALHGGNTARVSVPAGKEPSVDLY